jgi:hypothetical protein
MAAIVGSIEALALAGTTLVCKDISSVVLKNVTLLLVGED